MKYWVVSLYTGEPGERKDVSKLLVIPVQFLSLPLLDVFAVKLYFF